MRVSGGNRATKDGRFSRNHASAACSAATIDKIWKHKNGGWRVLIPIMGAVVGQSLDDFISREIEEIADERRRLEAAEARLRDRYSAIRPRGAVAGGRVRLVHPPDLHPSREDRRPG